MADLDAKIAAEIRSSLLSWQEVQADVATYNRLCEAGEWEQAEALRQLIPMHLEASLDAITRAHRYLEKIRNGEG